MKNAEKTKHGYTLISCKRSFLGARVALIDRNLRGDLVESFVVAWGYDLESDSWCQGHYFTTLDAARNYFNSNY
jgi:hypothetical protein